MLGRKTFTQRELDTARAAIDAQLVAYDRLARAVEATGDAEARAALAELEPLLFNQMTLALDRFFVHRLRMVTGKDGTPLNELELTTDSLINNGGVLRDNNVLRLDPAESVLRIPVGDRIALRAADFDRLAHAALAEIDAKFV